MSKLTPWFDGKKYKPTREGVYMLPSGSRTRTRIGYQYWDGVKWKLWEETPELAYARRAGDDAALMFQNDNWRGLASNPATRQSLKGKQS